MKHHQHLPLSDHFDNLHRLVSSKRSKSLASFEVDRVSAYDGRYQRSVFDEIVWNGHTHGADSQTATSSAIPFDPL